jgi:hypothetical protein
VGTLHANAHVVETAPRRTGPAERIAKLGNRSATITMPEKHSGGRASSAVSKVSHGDTEAQRNLRGLARHPAGIRFGMPASKTSAPCRASAQDDFAAGCGR